MNFRLHHEVDVTVVAAQPWGLDVESQDGTPGFVDQTKSPAWPSGDQDALVGTVLHAVVVDDRRNPVRLSALDTDLEIARQKRSATGN
ncbi:hypothetical protein [Streptomyces sp. NBC_00091]|uniref:hypothetical protein n=1 Tax=Streptomyces sp. NBC_00091 TaxID=2975648 RepID=UPI002254C018|nr:hypothetical protein [Streptomyces sp. NBC_00091]MCX5377975.1 hypothetical protein [Streptomyces sp. NBC_00091]